MFEEIEDYIVIYKEYILAQIKINKLNEDILNHILEVLKQDIKI